MRPEGLEWRDVPVSRIRAPSLVIPAAIGGTAHPSCSTYHANSTRSSEVCPSSQRGQKQRLRKDCTHPRPALRGSLSKNSGPGQHQHAHTPSSPPPLSIPSPPTHHLSPLPPLLQSPQITSFHFLPLTHHPPTHPLSFPPIPIISSIQIFSSPPHVTTILLPPIPSPNKSRFLFLVPPT